MEAIGTQGVSVGDPGLCRDCLHARIVESDRGSRFVQCRLALTDDRFEKYPRLPVITCSGYCRVEPAASDR